MSDSSCPRENHLKGKFKGMLDQLMGADRPCPTASRLEFMTPTLTDSILMRFRSIMRVPGVMGGGMSLVLPFPQKSKDQTGPQKTMVCGLFAVYRPVSVCISFNRFMTSL
ncbi:uncharacterized protein LACBIDRAFT_314771 [Laccaria bicolor S238N-H82]|uniref:Predicted protein n=1 Tax=Laccaria bicolor (strain S238N-H82 / ATCC MYA-4686) TaxID=486041 RepID=B0DZ75_LACBS|nr:uncharacterized protein LACBIDRAFT_314771 [Laccaria bicolor S238N-H82]EDR00189.1 predicted protein [Laccaria bicolor S238N-H82]|eukprot:XP_001889246.1 predicted protein [Laccaria bicolor S238N-H82]